MLYPLPSAPYSEPVLPASAATAPVAVNPAAGTPASAASSSTSSSSSPNGNSSGPTLWAHGGFSFKDLLDIVNPLQHLPVVGSVYRYLTGDEESGGARIIGDSLYGGPIGFGVSVVSTALFTDSSGKDLGERVLAGTFGPRDGSSTTPGTPAVAANTGAASTQGSPVAGHSAVTNQALANQALANQALANQALPNQALAQAPAQPVAMNNLFRSAPPSTPATPEQSFLAQNAQFQREVTQGRGTNGAVINGRPVPLELSSNLLPNVPAGAHIVMPPHQTAAAPSTAPAPTGQASASQTSANQPAAAISQAPANAPSSTTAPVAPEANPIAQKMIDALNKYEQLKRQEEQKDSSGQADPSKVDLSL